MSCDSISEKKSLIIIFKKIRKNLIKKFTNQSLIFLDNVESKRHGIDLGRYGWRSWPDRGHHLRVRNPTSQNLFGSNRSFQRHWTWTLLRTFPSGARCSTLRWERVGRRKLNSIYLVDCLIRIPHFHAHLGHVGSRLLQKKEHVS